MAPVVARAASAAVAEMVPMGRTETIPATAEMARAACLVLLGDGGLEDLRHMVEETGGALQRCMGAAAAAAAVHTDR